MMKPVSTSSGPKFAQYAELGASLSALLDALATGRESLPSLLERADADDGPFGDHLKRIVISVSRLPEVGECVRAVLSGSAVPLIYLNDLER